MRMGRLKRDTHSNLFGLNISNEEKSILTLTQYNKTFFFVLENNRVYVFSKPFPT
jgi:hypothetical protein